MSLYYLIYFLDGSKYVDSLTSAFVLFMMTINIIMI